MNTPEINYFKYRFRAVVDWIEIEIQTNAPVQAWRIQRDSVGGFSFVKGCDQTTGQRFDKSHENTPTTRFACLIQAPDRHADITAILSLDKIAGRLSGTVPVKASGIEVSFDAYSNPGTTAEDLGRMTSRFYWGLSRLVSPDMRLYHAGPGSGLVIPNQRSLAQEFMQGYTLGIGHRNDDIYQRIYFKRTDGITKRDEDQQRCESGQGKCDDKRPQLPESEQRARIEIRLQGKNVPVTTLDDLENLNFGSLSKYFNFRRLRPDLDNTTQQAMASVPRIGQPYRLNKNGEIAAINRSGGGTREFSKVTRADTPLNDRASDQLRKLTERWKGVSNTADKPFACGISGALDETGSNGRGHAIVSAVSQNTQAGNGCEANSHVPIVSDNCPSPSERSKDYENASSAIHVLSQHNGNEEMTEEDLRTLRSMGFGEDEDNGSVST